MKERSYDLVGIGAGPFNLSLAALAEPVKDLSSIFFEQRTGVAWHQGLLCVGSLMQTSYLKDLVTPVDPTNRHSFLNFIVRQGRFYDFVNAGYARISRVEFDQYLRWVSQNLATIALDERVERVEPAAEGFCVTTTRRVVYAAHVVVGTGLSPDIPDFSRAHLGEAVFHAADYISKKRGLAGKRLVVVGGGQSGADIVLDLLEDDRLAIPELVWITRRANFLPLDDSAFTNEYFRPSYVRHFARQDRDRRARLLEEQSLASNGITLDVLAALRRHLYARRFLTESAMSFRLMPETAWVGLGREGGACRVVTEDRAGRGRADHPADAVIVCTGWTSGLPPCVAPLAGLIRFEGDKPVLRADYSLDLGDGQPGRVYLQNGGAHARGIADPNLSLMAWRSAVILNSIAGREIYDTRDAGPIEAWVADPQTEETTRS